MILAMRRNERVYAQPNGRAVCPSCGGGVIAKCGTIVSWHWAHIGDDCDTWAEGESSWHIGWKRLFPEAWQEVAVGNHRAGIKTPTCVIELQNSPLDEVTILQREAHYGNMVWVVNASHFTDNLLLRERGDYTSFRWKWPRKSWWAATKPLYFDFDDGSGDLFHVKKIHRNTPCGGWGQWVDGEFFDFVGADHQGATA